MGQLELRDLLADVADGVDPAGPAIVDRALGEATRRRAVGLLLIPAIALLAAVTAVFVVVPHARQNALRPAGGSASVPREFPKYSLLTAYAEDAPGGRALAVLTYYNWDTMRTVALGADGRTFRRLGANDDLAAPFQAALSPDGRQAALASEGGSVYLQDLGTGKITSFYDAEVERFDNLRYSPDGTRLVMSSSVDGLFYVDLSSGRMTRILRPAPEEFAISPDGRRIAAQYGGRIRIVDWAGTTLHETDISSTGAKLGGVNAWTPDGRFVVTVHTPGGVNVPCTFRFVPTVAAADGAPAAVKIPDGSLVGWRGPGEMVVQERWQGGQQLTVRDVRSGTREVLASMRDAEVVSVSSGLMGQLGSHPDTGFDTGPWPRWLIVAIVVGSVLFALLVVVLWFVARWAIRVNRRPFPELS